MSMKPSKIKKHTIFNTNRVDQHAYQTLLLMRALPCLIYDRLNQLTDKDVLADLKNLVFLHLKILSIIFSTEIPESMIQTLEQLLVEHHLLFFATFPEASKINKLHQVLHYYNIIKKNGPCRFYNTCRFENKHQFFKKKAQCTNNFLNLTKTLSTTYSYDLLYKFKYGDSDYETNNKKKDQILSSLTYNNLTFKEGDFLCLERKQLPMFGQIKSIFKRNNNIVFSVDIVETIDFLEEYFGYYIKYPQTKVCKQILYENLEVKDVFYSWRAISSDIKIIFKDSLVLD